MLKLSSLFSNAAQKPAEWILGKDNVPHRKSILGRYLERQDDKRLEAVKQRFKQTEMGRALLDFAEHNNIHFKLFQLGDKLTYGNATFLESASSDDVLVMDIASTLRTRWQDQTMLNMRLPLMDQLHPDSFLGVQRLLKADEACFVHRFAEDLAETAGDKKPMEILQHRFDTPHLSQGDRMFWHVKRLTEDIHFETKGTKLAQERYINREQSDDKAFNERSPLIPPDDSTSAVLAYARVLDDTTWPLQSPAPTQNHSLEGYDNKTILSVLMAPVHDAVKREIPQEIDAMHQSYTRQLAAQQEQERQDAARLDALKQRLAQIPEGVAMLNFIRDNNITLKINHYDLEPDTGGDQFEDMIRLNAKSSDDRLIGTIAHETYHVWQWNQLDHHQARDDLSPQAGLAYTRFLEVGAYSFQIRFITALAEHEKSQRLLPASEDQVLFAKTLSDSELSYGMIDRIIQHGHYDKRELSKSENNLQNSKSHALLSPDESARAVLDVARKIDVISPFMPAVDKPIHYLADVPDAHVLAAGMAPVSPSLEKQLLRVNSLYKEAYAKQTPAQQMKAAMSPLPASSRSSS